MRRADDLVEQGPEGLDDEVERPGDEQRPVAESAVAAHPGDRLGKGPETEQVAEQLVAVEAELVDGGALVAAVEGAQEVAPVAAVEPEQLRPFGEQARHEPGALRRARGGGSRARRSSRRRSRR